MSSSYIDSKYISLLSSRLHNYRRKSGNLYNMSCVFCNDLEAHPRQGRAYIFEKQGTLRFFCHYCNKSSSIPNFIQSIDQVMYEEYTMEKLLDSATNKEKNLTDFVEKMKPPIFLKAGPLKDLKKISQLSHNDSMKEFVLSRKIPNEYHSKLFACPNFYSWVNTIIPDTFNANVMKYEERRLIIPFFDKNKNLHAFQGRTLNSKSKVKYITIVIDESKPKIYGLDTVDMTKNIIVQESPLDVVHLDNSIATAGGDLVSTVKSLPKDKCVITYDVEPRSKELVNKIEKAITYGYKVCIWPNHIEQKDVTEMRVAGLESNYIQYLIQNNTFSGLTAKAKLSEWRRC